MRRTGKLILVLVAGLSLTAVFLVTGCKSVALSSGDTTTVELPANATTGYSWSYKMSQTGILEEQSSSYKADDSGNTGAGGAQTYVFKASGDGDVTIHFIYKQDWDGGNTSNNGATYNYSISNGKITLTSSVRDLDGM